MSKNSVKDRNPTLVNGNASRQAPRAIPLWKRVLDIACIILFLPVTGPLFLLIAAGIKIVSRGPILFCQPRIGYSGKLFTCLKFRTMRVDANTTVHEDHFKDLMQSKKPMTKLDFIGDERLIPFGLLLRSSGLDELPQLLNVWCGDMSLVGPRPCTPHEYRNYQPWHKQRFGTLPGLTGLWQVSGKNSTTFDEMIRLDIRYAQTRSFIGDLGIMARTLPVLVSEVHEMLKRRRLKTNGKKAGSEQHAGNRSNNGFETKPLKRNGRQAAVPATTNGQRRYSSKPASDR